MLCGIGGRTIAEAKHRLSYAEFCDWVRYREKRGSFNPGIRSEWGFSLLASIYANSKSKNGGYKLYDFAPHIEEPTISLDSALENWT